MFVLCCDFIVSTVHAWSFEIKSKSRESKIFNTGKGDKNVLFIFAEGQKCLS